MALHICESLESETLCYYLLGDEIDIGIADANCVDSESRNQNFSTLGGLNIAHQQSRLKFSKENVDSAVMRHKEDITAGAMLLKGIAKQATSDILHCMILSIGSLNGRCINTTSLESLKQSVSDFRRFGFRITNSNKYMRKFEQMQSAFLCPALEYVIENRLGSSLQVQLILMSYLLALGFEVRLVGALNPCSQNPVDHKDILCKQRKTMINQSSHAQSSASLSSRCTSSGRFSGKKRIRMSYAEQVINSTNQAIANSKSSSFGQPEIVEINESFSEVDDIKMDEDSRTGEKLVSSCWLEVYLCMPIMSSSQGQKAVITSSSKCRWVHCDYLSDCVDQPKSKSTSTDISGRKSSKFKNVAYATAVDRCGFLTDVTPRYSTQYHYICDKYRLKNDDSDWWTSFIDKHNIKCSYITFDCQERAKREEEEEEEELLQDVLDQTTMPSCVAAFKNHPVFVLERFLRNNELPSIDLKENDVAISSTSGDVRKLKDRTQLRLVHSYFKGEKVYLRRHVKQLLSRRDWYKRLRKVKPECLLAPLKVISKSVSTKHASFTSHQSSGLNSENLTAKSIEMKLYSLEQTDPYRVPSVLSDGVIPTNSYGNIEIWDGDEALVPIGCSLITHKHAVEIASNLGFYHAPALFGFDVKLTTSSSSNADGKIKIPKIGGIVVLERDKCILTEALMSLSAQKNEAALKAKREVNIRRWQKLVVQLLSIHRLRATYVSS